MEVYHKIVSPTVTLLDHATRLAEGYYQVEYVFHQAADGTIAPYCAPEDWPTSLAAQLTAKDNEIAALRERLAALEASAAAPAPQAEPETAPAIRIPCDICGELYFPRGMKLHFRCAHPDATPDEPPPAQRITTTMQIVPDDPTWHCAQCNGTAFARSVKDSTRCTRCVAPTNGRVLEVLR